MKNKSEEEIHSSTIRASFPTMALMLCCWLDAISQLLHAVLRTRVPNTKVGATAVNEEITSNGNRHSFFLSPVSEHSNEMAFFVVGVLDGVVEVVDGNFVVRARHQLHIFGNVTHLWNFVYFSPLHGWRVCAQWVLHTCCRIQLNI